MIQCRQCGHSNLTGAVLCFDCGALLIGQFAADGSPTSTSGNAEAGRRNPTTTSWATLYVGDGSEPFRLMQGEKFILGRGDENLAKRPDIDLSRFDAYANGVSRMHAVIKRKEGQIVLMDLDSANGTYINGRRLGSRQEVGLEDGDVIGLGALKIQLRLKARK